jgi:hypothetical protein
MSKLNEAWNVQPHGALEELDDGLLTVVGTIGMPLMEFPRRMTVVRLRGRRLVVWSAIALDDAAMARLERAGHPGFLVVPNGDHRLDARAWKRRFPELQVVAPEGARAKVADAVPVDTTAPDFADSDVDFLAVPGTRGREAALVVRRRGGTTLVLNDLVGNVRGASGLRGWLLRRMGFAGAAAHIPALVRLRLVQDREALRAQLLRWADDATLCRIVVSHGEVIASAPQQALRDLAASLA